MQRLMLQLNKKRNRYETQESTGKTIWILERFFHDFYTKDIEFFKKWTLNKDFDEIYFGNTICIKKEYNVIKIGSIFSDYKDGGPYFKLLVPEFNKLLVEWEKLIKAKAQEITIIEENGVITIEAE